MDPKVNSVKGAPLSARYYTPGNRGQRDIRHSVAEIPVGLHRCHLTAHWYGELPEWHRKTILPSPHGWEVDEELNSVQN
jgi:hypothetical protein